MDCASPFMESACADAFATAARAMQPPDWMNPLKTRVRSSVTYRLESPAIRIDVATLVESPGQYFWLTSPQISSASPRSHRSGFPESTQYVESLSAQTVRCTVVRYGGRPVCRRVGRSVLCP